MPVQSVIDKVIEGHNVEWWKYQWDQMKLENDRINPELDAAKLSLSQLGADNQALKQQVATLTKTVAELKAALLTKG